MLLYGSSLGNSVALPAGAVTRLASEHNNPLKLRVLYRYGDFTGYDIDMGSVATLDTFTDIEGIAEWAVEPLSWACSHGLMIGVGGGKIDPNGGLTRAQLATLLYRLDDIFVDY